MTGLFMMARDASDKQICIIHTVVMILLLVGTGIFHYRLCCIFKPIITYIPVCLGSIGKEKDPGNYDEEDGGEAQIYTTGVDVLGRGGKEGQQQEQQRRRPSLRSLSAIFYPHREAESIARAGGGSVGAAIQEEGPYNHTISAYPSHARVSPVSGVFPPAVPSVSKHGLSSDFYDGIETTLANLTASQRSHLVSRAFHHVAVHAARPCVWIPRDDSWIGVAQDQVEDIRLNYPHVLVSLEGCEISANGKVVVKRVPPDYDPTQMMRL